MKSSAVPPPPGDDDSDNYCDNAMTVVGTPTTCTAGGSDCNDMSGGVSPGAVELCDAIDQDCDGAPRDGCPLAPTLNEYY